MKFAIFTTTMRERSSVLSEVEAQRGWWVRFGDDLLVYAANNKFDSLTGQFPGATRKTRQNDGSVRKGNMHLVVQNGRNFQLENPNVRVILDKGRFLVVDLPRTRAARLSDREDTCFHIEPLRENMTIFTTVKREESTFVSTPGVAEIVSSAQSSGFESRLTHLTSYPTRFSTSQHFSDAAEWAFSQFAGLGLSTAIIPITIPGAGDSANIVAQKTGSGDAGRKNILIVAHLDSVNHPGGPGANAPGADDNASGSAGLLTMAETLATATFTHDLTFVLFGGEEQGLHGSSQYLASLSGSEKAVIHAVLNMDMIGSLNSIPAAVLLEGAALSQWMIDRLAGSAVVHTALEVQTSLNPFASDHVPFLNAQIPAVLTIEGADGANAAIHTGNDSIDLIDVNFAMDILRMNLGFVAEEAGLVAIPEVVCECGDSSSGVNMEVVELTRVLSGHFQNLFSQYSRLNRDGLIGLSDYNNWQIACATHDALAASAGLPKITDR